MIRSAVLLAALVATPAFAQSGTIDLDYGDRGFATALPEARPIRLADLTVSPSDEAVYVGWSGRTETEAFVGRVTVEGKADAAFGEAGRVAISVEGSNETLRAVAVRADGHILATGQATPSGDVPPTQLLVAHLDAAGRPATVSVIDLGESARGEGIAVTADRTYLAVSLLDSQTCAVVGLDAESRLDAAFGTDGLVVLPAGSPCEAADLARTEAGIALVGTLAEGRGQVVIAQVTLDGALDTAFGTDGVAQRGFDSSRNKASSLAVAPDGTLIVGGLSRKGSVAGPLLLRFDAAGAPLATFGYEGLYWSASAPQDGIYAEPPGVAVTPDGGVVFATTTAPTVRLTVGGVTPEGTRDRSFGTDGFTTADASVSAYSYGRGIAVDSQGRLLVGGEAIVSGTLHRLVISRLSTTAAATSSEPPPVRTGSLRIAPNPTLGPTRVRASIAEPSLVRAIVLDSLGRQVATLHDGAARAGDLDLDWDASQAAPGLYLVQVQMEDHAITRTLTVAR